MTQLRPQPENITRLFDAVYPSFAMLAGMELELFTHLKDGPLTVESLAMAMNVPAIKLRPLLYVLVVAGLLIVEDKLFSNTSEADHYLVRGKSDYLGGMHELTSGNWGRMLKTAGTIRNGGPLEEYDYHSAQEELVGLFRGLYPGAVLDASRLMERYDFSGHNTLLDVGGGSGGLAIAMVQGHPHLSATVADLPSITPITQQFIEEANAGARVKTLAVDAIHDSLPGAFDVIVARHLIQVLSADESLALLRNLYSVLRPGGVLHLVGWILDDSRTAPSKTVGYNLLLLNAYEDGQAYTAQEYFDWLAEAGFANYERVVLADGGSILTARKPL